MVKYAGAQINNNADDNKTTKNTANIECRKYIANSGQILNIANIVQILDK